MGQRHEVSSSGWCDVVEWVVDDGHWVQHCCLFGSHELSIVEQWDNVVHPLQWLVQHICCHFSKWSLIRSRCRQLFPELSICRWTLVYSRWDGNVVLLVVLFQWRASYMLVICNLWMRTLLQSLLSSVHFAFLCNSAFCLKLSRRSFRYTLWLVFKKCAFACNYVQLVITSM